MQDSGEELVPGAARVLPHVSASQIKTWRRCNRLWALEKIWKKRSPQTAAQSAGTRIHAVMEHWLKNKEWLETKDTNALAIVKQAVAAGNLPEPGKDLLVEHEIRISLPKGLPDLMGFVDIINPRDPQAELLTIGDHKSTANFSYCMTPEDLLEDVQMIAYSKWGYEAAGFLAQFSGNDFWKDKYYGVKVEHIYLHKKIRESRVVSALPSVEHVDKKWEGIIKDVGEMVACAAAPPSNALGIPGNRNACGMYGGCPNREFCGITTSLLALKFKAERTDMERKGESLKEMLEKKRETQGYTPVPIQPPLPPPLPPVQEIPKKKIPAIPILNRSFTILLDCVPIVLPEGEKSPVQLETWLAPIADQVAKEFGVPHWGLIEYGKGKAALAAAIGYSLETLPLVISVTTGVPGADVFMEAASPRATTIIRGI